MKLDVSWLTKYDPVFNIEYITGIAIESQEFELNTNENIKKCEELVEKMLDRPEIKFIDSNHANYLPS